MIGAKIISTIGLVIIMLLPASAWAEGLVGHIAIYGGIGVPEDFSNVEGRGDLAGVKFSDLKLNSGPIVGLKLGFFGPAENKLASWLGLELDASYLQSNVKDQDITLTGPGGSLPGRISEGDVDFVTGALHLLVKYPGSVLQPYIGAGPAAIYAKSSDVNLAVSGIPIARLTEDHAVNVGLSGVAGFRLLVSEHVGLFAEYKHIRTNLEFGALEGDAVLHAGVGGINFTF
jgi:hypothetical protein